MFRRINGAWNSPARRCLLTALGLLAVAAFIVLTAIQRYRCAAELVTIVSTIPTGVSIADAEAILGSPADDQAAVRGVVATDSTFISAGLPGASSYGEYKTYRMHLWRRNRENVVVVSDLEGHVVCRFIACREGSALLRRLKLMLGL
jgi:hypothetical protein